MRPVLGSFHGEAFSEVTFNNPKKLSAARPECFEAPGQCFVDPSGVSRPTNLGKDEKGFTEHERFNLFD